MPAHKPRSSTDQSTFASTQTSLKYWSIHTRQHPKPRSRTDQSTLASTQTLFKPWSIHTRQHQNLAQVLINPHSPAPKPRSSPDQSTLASTQTLFKPWSIHTRQHRKPRSSTDESTVASTENLAQVLMNPQSPAPNPCSNTDQSTPTSTQTSLKPWSIHTRQHPEVLSLSSDGLGHISVLTKSFPMYRNITAFLFHHCLIPLGRIPFGGTTVFTQFAPQLKAGWQSRKRWCSFRQRSHLPCHIGCLEPRVCDEGSGKWKQGWLINEITSLSDLNVASALWSGGSVSRTSDRKPRRAIDTCSIPHSPAILVFFSQDLLSVHDLFRCSHIPRMQSCASTPVLHLIRWPGEFHAKD